jgi:hypothetical protein
MGIKTPRYKQDLFFALLRTSWYEEFKARRFNPSSVRKRPLITWRTIAIEYPRKLKASKWKNQRFNGNIDNHIKLI